MNDRMSKRWLSPAADIIGKFSTPGSCGAIEIASILRVHPSRVYRWMYAKEYGGTGGLIPLRHQKRLMQEARSRNIALSAAEIIGATADEPQVGEEVVLA